MAAEQENRVQIPDGTAAVCTENPSFGESQSLGNREGRRIREVAALRCTSQKTYAWDSPFTCVIMGEVLVAEKRLRHRTSVPQPSSF